MNDKQLYEILRCAKVAASEAAESKYSEVANTEARLGNCQIILDGRGRLVRHIKLYGKLIDNEYVFNEVILSKERRKWIIRVPYSCAHREELEILEEASKAIIHVLRNIDQSVKYEVINR